MLFLKQILKYLCLVFLILIFTSCQQLPGQNNSSGSMYLRFKYPQTSQTGFSLKFIPAKTAYITIVLEGKGLTLPLLKRVSKINRESDSASLLIASVPLGEKKIIATAFDQNDNFLAQGENTLEIKPNLINRVNLELRSKKEELILNFVNIGYNTERMILLIETEESTIFKNIIVEPQLILKDLPVGTLKIMISSLDRNSIPISSGYFELELNEYTKEYNLKLLDVELPKEDEIILPENISNINVSELETLPNEFKEKIDEIFIKYEGNKTPELLSLKVAVNDIPTDFNINNPRPVITQLDDFINIDLDIKDNEGDTVGILWSIINNETKKVFVLERLTTTENLTNMKVPVVPGAYTLSFLLVDGNSYAGPYFIPLEVRQGLSFQLPGNL